MPEGMRTRLLLRSHVQHSVVDPGTGVGHRRDVVERREHRSGDTESRRGNGERQLRGRRVPNLDNAELRLSCRPAYSRSNLRVYGVVVETLMNPDRSRIGRENSVESLCMSRLPSRKAERARSAVRAR